MDISPQSQSTIESLRRVTVSALAAIRTLLAFAQASDWNGRTLTALLLSTSVCYLTEGCFESFHVSILLPSRHRFQSLCTRMAKSASHTANRLSKGRNRRTVNAVA